MQYSGYRLLWLQVLFDLPVVNKEHRKQASDFRNQLLELGFSMAQFSVYMRYCKNKEQAETFIKKIERAMPNQGTIHILIITDKQYESIKTFYCGTKSRLKNPDQLILF
jgi:CRISPR-associated protein Cas2